MRLNGGNRLVSTYGAKPAVVPAGWPGEGDGAGEEGDGDGLRLGVAVGVGVGAVADGLGVGEAVLPPPGWQGAPSIVQSCGAAADPSTTKPTSAAAPGSIAPSQPAFVTVTWPPLTSSLPFHRLLSEAPPGSRNPRAQPAVAAAPSLVIVYRPV